jgi:IMP dehydrogenase
MNAVSGKRNGRDTLLVMDDYLFCLKIWIWKHLKEIINHIKNADIKYDTPMTVKADNTIRDALGIIHKRAHNCVIISR